MTVNVDEETTMVVPHQLTANDRCDSCGAQAYMRATLPGGGELLFCGHHGRKNKEKLVGMGAIWHDESDRLVASRD